MRGHERPPSTYMVRIMILRDADQTARRFSADDFLAVEPLHGSLRHMTLPSGRCVKKAARQPQPVRSRFGEKSSVRRGVRGEAKSFGRSSMAAMWAIALGSARFAPRVFKRKTCSKWPVME